MSNSLLSAPTLSGTMNESSLYNFMSVGLTDSILLIGHADAAIMYEPYQVVNAKKAVKFLNSESKSPLLRAFLEAYNAGCKDIWLYPAAPMSEYEPTVSQRNIPNPNLGNQTFYQKYYARLTTVYASLKDYDFAEIIVPVEAVFYDSGQVDFLGQLVNYCKDSFINTGTVCLGIIGTRFSTSITSAIVDAMVKDTRIAGLGDGGKFVLIAAGEGTMSQSQMSTTYVASVATTVASIIATAKLDRSILGLVFPNVSNLVGNDLTQDQIERLAQAKINIAVRTTRGKRGYAYQARLNTDNTLGQDGSDFWSMAQMHIVAHTINSIRQLGYHYIAEANRLSYEKFHNDVNSHLNNLVANQYIKNFTLSITTEDSIERAFSRKALVNVSILPIFGIRQISFTVEVGPG